MKLSTVALKGLAVAFVCLAAMVLFASTASAQAQEPITQTLTIVPEPTDIFNEQEFRILYTRTRTHLLQDWAMLIGFGLLFGLATAIVLRQKDIS